ncbi:MAG: metallophosphoesterase [Candidatus Asgardarchaeia archaeon]
MRKVYSEIVRDPTSVGFLEHNDLIEMNQDIKEIFSEEDMLLNLNFRRLIVVGDTHGDLNSTLNVTKKYLMGEADAILFLGDYVDRGPKQLENICYLFSLKLLHKDRVFLLRGNHETISINKYYGFFSILRHSKKNGDLYHIFNDTFSYMPVSAKINEKIFAVHGGISSKIKKVEEINSIPKGDIEGEDPKLLELLWNDPREGIRGFRPSMRGPGIYVFGRDVFEEFMKENSFELMLRSHEVFNKGFKYFFDNRLISIFSSREYVGRIIEAKAVLIEGNDVKLIDIV